MLYTLLECQSDRSQALVLIVLYVAEQQYLIDITNHSCHVKAVWPLVVSLHPCASMCTFLFFLSVKEMGQEQNKIKKS